MWGYFGVPQVCYEIFTFDQLWPKKEIFDCIHDCKNPGITLLYISRQGIIQKRTLFKIGIWSYGLDPTLF